MFFFILIPAQSVNVVTEDLIAGHRPEGRMSSVRRFFCLFVTFDILFTSLMWLICVMVSVIFYVFFWMGGFEIVIDSKILKVYKKLK